MLEVGGEVAQDVTGALVADGFFRRLQTARAQGGAAPGFASRHIRGQLAIHFARQVVAQLVVEIAIGAPGVEHFVDAFSQAAEPGHRPPRLRGIENALDRDGGAEPRVALGLKLFAACGRQLVVPGASGVLGLRHSAAIQPRRRSRWSAG